MANPVETNANQSIRPKLVELINGMTEDQCQKLFENMQAMGKNFNKEYPATTWSAKRHQERRSVSRVDYHCPVSIEGTPGQQAITNLSVEGAFVECDDACMSEFSTGELIRLSIKPSGEKNAVMVKAQIVNFSDRGMHCRFAHLDRKTKDTIRHWLHKG